MERQKQRDRDRVKERERERETEMMVVVAHVCIHFCTGRFRFQMCLRMFNLVNTSTLKSGTSQLSHSTLDKNKTMFIVRITCTATELFIWATRNEHGKEEVTS